MIFKRIIIFLYVFSLFLQALGGIMPAYAQSTEATDVPVASDSALAASAAAQIPLEKKVSQEGQSVLGTIDKILENTDVISHDSPRIKRQTKIKDLSQKQFKGNEKIKFALEKDSENDITVFLIDSQGKKQEAQTIEKFTKDSVGSISVLPPRDFRPGKYTIQIDDGQKNVSSYEVIWGVLAINTNKSLYAPGEMANLQIAVLDEAGDMVCDADLKLTIKDPSGKVTTLSTKDKTIESTEFCTKKVFTLEPDYKAQYETSGKGIYEMKLLAKTKNGDYDIVDTFEVQEDAPFSIERLTATRIFPVNAYPVTLAVTARDDFKGIVREYVPVSFDISEQISDGSVKRFDTVEKMSEPEVTGSLTSAVLGASTIVIQKPFVGDFPTTQPFGEQYKDKNLVEKVTHSLGFKGHEGVDFDMPEGTSVLAAADGKVIVAGEHDYGITVTVEHAWGKTYYGHLSEVLVKEGDEVKVGQQIARSGSTGESTGPHLHFGMKLHDSDNSNGYEGMIDPLAYLPELQSKVLGASADSQSVKEIMWQVDIKKGETVKVGYVYNAPLISPEMYLLGEAHLTNSAGDEIFAEKRKWQIASDSVVVSTGIVETEAQFGGLQRKLVYVSSNWYAFYNDGTDVSYKKSSDGVSWGSAVEVSATDNDNYNPSVALSNSIIHVWWIDDDGDSFQGKRIDTASADAQGTECNSADQGAFSSTNMVSVASVSDTAVIVAGTDSSSGTDFNGFSVTGLSGSCTFSTDLTPGGITFGSGLTASDQPVLATKTSTRYPMVFQDGDLSYAELNSQSNDWLYNNLTLASVIDSNYSVVNDGTNTWILTVNGTTGTKLYKCCTTDVTSTTLDADNGANNYDASFKTDIVCPTSDNCKVIFSDDSDTTAPIFKFVDCNDETCSSPTITSVDTDYGNNASGGGVHYSIYCPASDDCKLVYGDDLDTTAPKVKFVDCNDESCSSPTISTLDADTGSSTSQLATSIYCPAADDCKVMYNDTLAAILFFVDCNNASCSAPTITNVDTSPSTRPRSDIYCPAADDCKIIYHDSPSTRARFIDCNNAACSSVTGTDIDTTLSGSSGQASVGIDCVGGSTDCKVIYTDSGGALFAFVDCPDSACTASGRTITSIDTTGIGATTSHQVDIDCVSATDCKLTYTGDNTSTLEKSYFIDCDDATCSTGSAMDLPVRWKTSVNCPSSTNCKFASLSGTSSTNPALVFMDCSNTNCYPAVTEVTAPWTSQTNVTSVSLTYDSSNSDLYAHIIKDSSEQAYVKSTDATTISWGSESSYGFTAGDLGHISAIQTAAGTTQVGVVLRQNANFEFATPPSGISIAGTCDQYDQSTDCSDDGSNGFKVALDGALQAQTDATVDGAWEITGVTTPSSGTVVTVFIDGESTASERATGVTKYDGTGSITGMKLFQRHLTLGSDDNPTLSNTNLSQYDYSASTNDTDVIFDIDSNSDLTVDNLGNYSDEKLYILSGTTYQPGTGNSENVNTHDLQNLGTFDMTANTVAVSGSWTNSGTFSDTCSGSFGQVNFTSGSSGETLSGTLNGSSDFCRVNFNGSGGGWTIQNPMKVSAANQTDTLQVTAGTVTLGNGDADNLEVNGKMTIASGATFQSMTGLAQGSAIILDINNNSSPVSCTNCTIAVDGTLDIDKNVTVRLNSQASVESGINVSTTGILQVQGTQDDTDNSGIDSVAHDAGSTITLSDASQSWTTDEHQNKYVRITNTASLAYGYMYAISSNAANALTIADSYNTEDTGASIAGSGNKRTITTAASLIAATDEAVGQYVYNSTDGTYFEIIDTIDSGSTDSLVIIASPDAFPGSLAGKTIKIADGIKATDTFEILDFAAVVGHATNGGFIHTATGGDTTVKYAEASYLGAETSNKYGISGASIAAANANEGLLVEKSYLHNNNTAIYCDSCSNMNSAYTAGARNNFITSSTNEAIEFISGSNYEAYGNRIKTTGGSASGISLYQSSNSLVAYNVVTAAGTSVLLDGQSGNVIESNKLYESNNYAIDVATDSTENVLRNNRIFMTGATAIYIHGTSVQTIEMADNIVDVSAVLLDISNSAAVTIQAANEKYGYYSGAVTADVRYQSTGAHKARFYNSYFGSSTEVSGVTTANAYLASFKHDQTAGSVKVWNDYVVPDEVSETPQTEGTQKINYADSQWEDSVAPHYYTGTGSDDTNLSFALSGGTLGGSGTSYSYYVVCKNSNCITSGTDAWDVFRDGVDIGDATTTSAFTDGTTNVQFTIDDAGTDSVRGDAYSFIAYQDATDTSTQKTLTMMQTSDSFTVGSGETLQLVGTSGTNTLIQKDSGSSGYDFAISGGTLNASYYTFTGQAAAGLNISSGTVTSLSNGTFDDHGGSGGSDTYVTVAAAVLDAGAAAFTGMVFDDTTTDSNVNYNVTLSGTPSSCSNTWTFTATGNLGGVTNGEAGDSDGGDGGGCNSGSGYLLWLSAGPTNDQLMRHGKWFSSGVEQGFTF